MKRIATLDIETDPFLYGRIPLPFACGFFDGETYRQTWGDNCIAEMVEILYNYKEPLEIFAHNGGKFDYYYFAYVLHDPIRFVKNRLISAALAHHTVRDSYAIIPAPLRDYKKDDTNYAHFEREQREHYKPSISKYLRHDCEYLYDLVSAFVEKFGNKLTIASTALQELQRFTNLQHHTADFDTQFRPYYYGGRVECFEKGIIKDRLKVYDINSSYPNAMRNFEHPKAGLMHLTKLPTDKVYFANIVADSQGALPVRTKLGLFFPHVKDGEFFACSHEIESGVRNRKLKIKKVLSCVAFAESQNFADFVDHFYVQKIAADQAGNKIDRLFYKLLLNNAYGKFAQNPDTFLDFTINPSQNVLPDNPWIPAGHFGEAELWKRKAQSKYCNFWDVSIGASITSAARAYLFDALQKATRPVYCDTDSIICESLDCSHDPLKLGAWKLEAEMDCIAIAGKKMYACFQRGKCVKAASKGIPTDPEFIRKIAASNSPHEMRIPAPSYRIGREPSFITRKITRT